MNRCLCLFLLTASLGLGGCTTVSRMIGPTTDYEDPTEMTSDPWARAAAEEGRRGFARETVNDPLNLRQYFMSEKARSIERNVGIE